MNTIETRLADAQGLLALVAYQWSVGEKEHAAEELEEACMRLLVLAREMRAEAPADEGASKYTPTVQEILGMPASAEKQELQNHCGHCGHLCNVNELKSGACPRCGTLKDGVLVVAKVDKWQEREEAELRKPQGHAVRVNGWMV